jgi:hypothetical protein
VNRTRAWVVVSPVIAAGVLVGHALAYRLASAPTDPFHEYLAHAPQVLLLLALSGLALAATGPARGAPSAWVFAVIGPATFVAQEHVERIVHGGGVPMLVTTPVFVVGLALQIPVALLAWAVAHRLLAAVGGEPARTALTARLEFPLQAAAIVDAVDVVPPRPLSRGPPIPVPAR